MGTQVGKGREQGPMLRGQLKGGGMLVPASECSERYPEVPGRVAAGLGEQRGDSMAVISRQANLMVDTD